jgi:hypothetical protein
MKVRTICEVNKVGIIFTPQIGGDKVECMIERQHANEWPIQSYTCTSPMSDFIGDIESIDGDKCSVKGVYRGKLLRIKNIKVMSSEIKKPGDRVMVTEHLNVNGHFELLATKKRILLQPMLENRSTVNFINIGWSNDDRSRYLVVDIYTGNFRERTNKPLFMLTNG